jgi:hydrophobic/amphiphilic exporter-1 (mainly G- bacteria), HAE1 family
MSWLTRLSLRNRAIVALAVVVVIIAGAAAVASLKQELLPNMSFPFLTIVTLEQGASPANVERAVTTPIEAVVKSSQSLKEVSSYSNEGMSIIMAQYEFGTDMKSTLAEVQGGVQRLQGSLPAGVQPMVNTLNFNDFPVVQLAVVPGPGAAPQQFADVLKTKVVPLLQQINGVANVSLSGTQQLQLRIQLRPADVLRLGVSPAAIVTALQSANLVMPVGTMTSGTMSLPVTVTNTTATLAAFRALAIAPATTATAAAALSPAAAAARPTTGGPVRLGDIADVVIKPAPETAITRTNGKVSAGIAVSKTREGNTVLVADGVAKLLPKIREQLGGLATVTTITNQATYIKDSISSMWREGLLGAVFAVLVIFFFLRNWRSTLVAGLSIPLSVVGALIILWGRGNSLNTITLGGLTIAIGRVIDDSIVVLENTYRHLQEGDDVHTAAFTATREVAGAITASTLTTIAVFLPLGFVKGFSAEYFRPFGLTVTFALIASLLVAFTVIPVAITYVLSKRQVGHREAHEITKLQRGYLPVLRWTTSHKIATILIAVATLVPTGLLFRTLDQNMFDNSGQHALAIVQQMPAGTNLQATSQAAKRVEQTLRQTPGVQTYQVVVGSTGDLFGPGGGTNASSGQAQYTVTTDPKKDPVKVMTAVRAAIAKLGSTVGSVAVTSGEAMFGSNSNLEVRVAADDPAVLKRASALVLAAVGKVSGLVNVQSNLSESRPQLAVSVNAAKAAQAQVQTATVGQMLALVVSGIPVGTLPTEVGNLPGVIALPGEMSVAPALLGELPVPAGADTVPLGSIATVRQTDVPAQITHMDGKRTASVSATVTSNNVSQASADVQKAINGVSLPAGAGVTMAGAGQETKDVQRTLGIAMMIAIILVYLIMVATFRSLLNPLILLVSIPFAAVGAVIFMAATGTSLGMPALIGLLMLVGIVVTNAIVLLDLIERFRRDGMPAAEAVIQGGRRRLRPILMTAAATILALVPMALGLGDSGMLNRPLAVVVIGGLFSSTLLTLVLVPVLYLAFDRARVRRRDARTATPAVAGDGAVEAADEA